MINKEVPAREILHVRQNVSALRDKLTTYNRVIEPQPIAGESGNTLSRIGRKGVGSLRERTDDKYL